MSTGLIPAANQSYGNNTALFFRVWDAATHIIRTAQVMQSLQMLLYRLSNLKPEATIIGPSVADGGPGISGWAAQFTWFM